MVIPSSRWSLLPALLQKLMVVRAHPEHFGATRGALLFLTRNSTTMGDSLFTLWANTVTVRSRSLSLSVSHEFSSITICLVRIVIRVRAERASPVAKSRRSFSTACVPDDPYLLLKTIINKRSKKSYPSFLQREHLPKNWITWPWI